MINHLPPILHAYTRLSPRLLKTRCFQTSFEVENTCIRGQTRARNILTYLYSTMRPGVRLKTYTAITTPERSPVVYKSGAHVAGSRPHEWLTIRLCCRFAREDRAHCTLRSARCFTWCTSLAALWRSAYRKRGAAKLCAAVIWLSRSCAEGFLSLVAARMRRRAHGSVNPSSDVNAPVPVKGKSG